ncbi:hypothetical protein CkaCkLH20_02941 [Colletotrichum karsti]|uniref:Fe2OG dioxygenase domain-containing protein n=1 Tax=Colletotrichum karsti TaxID=1095194 RepID=A0A9P6I906_9PEZI|nr:uncharacterized protein CkaCkLH20_02941 [Colletotrichum karsti]KAF9879398.1 hypothetical protein CkaCkLH20_02941 [Colletotrichum karsti]
MAASKPRPMDDENFRIWADNRQALCDALPYFKSHEGSLYTSLKVAKGILINKHDTVRDMLGSEVIITTLGGGRKKNDQGVYFRTGDGSKIVLRAATLAMEAHSPIGVILGNKYPSLSIPLEHVYNVLDFFTLTDIWSERDTRTTDGVSVWKIRLEKTDRTKKSWWGSGDAVDPSVGGFPEERQHCNKCLTPSKQMFSQGWTCLNDDCEDTFIFPGGISPMELTFASDEASPLAWCTECHKSSKTIFKDGWTCLNKACATAYFKFPAGVDVTKLSYSKEFLQERTAHTLPVGYMLQPPLPRVGAGGFLGTEKQMRVGIVCPLCGCCSRRKFWTRWAYENPVCGFVLNAKPSPLPVTSIHIEEYHHNRMASFANVKADFNILRNGNSAEGYAMEQYLLPDPLDITEILGSVTVFRSTPVVNQHPGGPDRMWHHLLDETAKDNFGLQRNAAIHPGLPSEKFTRNFLQNFGAPYKFAVDVATKSFNEAPESIIAALKRLRWAGRVSVENMNNALEDENLDVVRDSVSDRFVDFNELLFIGYMEDDRIGYHDDGESTLGPTVATLSLGSPAQMMFRCKSRYVGQNPTGMDPVVLKLPLRHGDMVVMHGTRIHQAYEHAVNPKGRRRFALTSRYIVPETLDASARAEAAKKSLVRPIPAFWDFPGATSQTASTRRATTGRKRRSGEVDDTKKTKKPKTKA